MNDPHLAVVDEREQIVATVVIPPWRLRVLAVTVWVAVRLPLNVKTATTIEAWLVRFLTTGVRVETKR